MKQLYFTGLIFLVIIFFGVFGMAESSWAADRYVRSGATGINNGSDWTNAWTALPATLTRGDTYYLADGSYGSYNFNTAVSGSAYVYIKKATAANHGTNTGWQDSYGDGTAEFTGLTINANYLDIDGVTGGGLGNWKTGHGIVFTKSAGISSNFIDIAAGVSDINIRRIKFIEVGNTESGTAGAAGIYTSTVYNLLVERCYFENLNRLPFFFRNGSGITIQYNYSGDICGVSNFDYTQHCEALVEWTLSDVQFRWNYIADSPSSGGFVKNAPGESSNVRIYGNVFNTGSPVVCNTGTCTNWRVFNNTFVHNNYGPFGGDGAANGLLFYNNISFDNSALTAIGQYDWMSQIGQNQCQTNANSTNNVIIRRPESCDIVTETLDPFVYSSGDTPEYFRLSGPITNWPGYNVCQLDACTGENKFNIDLFGNIRGTDGVWDRGAYEYAGGSLPVDPTPPSVSLTAPAAGSTVSGLITVSANASDNVAVAGVQFRLDGTNLGSEDTISPYSISWNTTGASNGSHTLSAIARDTANNQTTSSGITVTVSNTVFDTQAPTVPTNLSATAVSSSQINLSWTASIDNVAVTGYRIYRGGTQIGTSASNSYANTALSSSTTYIYTVSAYDAANNASGQSASASATTPAVSGTFAIGDRVQVVVDPSLRVRSTPGLSDTTILGTQPVSAQGTIIGGPVSADSFTWWQINYDASPDGWSIELNGATAYLALAASDTTPPAAPSGLVVN